MHRMALLVGFLVACGAGPSTKRPATDAIDTYLGALADNDPDAAYRLLGEEVRDRVSRDVFRKRWRAHKLERKRQAQSLRQALRSRQGLTERARVEYRDGKRISLSREGGTWRLATTLAGQDHAGTPTDAVELLARALVARDVERLLGVMTKDRRQRLAKMLTQLTDGLAKRGPRNVARVGKDRAELLWESGDTRFKINLKLEDGDWRVDDVQVTTLDRVR